VVFDPWSEGPVRVGPPGFHLEWHVGPVLPASERPNADVVVVSQRFRDHCHPDTLRTFPAETRVLSVPDASRSTKRAIGRPVDIIPPWGSEPLTVGELRFWRMSRAWWHQPMYHVIIVADPSGRAALHAPHAHDPKEAADIARHLTVELAAVSRQRYKLPFYLGGLVNPGPVVADQFVAATRAKRAFPVHDEPKGAKGLVSRSSTIYRPEPTSSWPWVDVDPVLPFQLA